MYERWDTVRSIIAEADMRAFGYKDVLGEQSSIAELNVQHIGGGYLYTPKIAKQVNLIHLVPHGGITIPTWCKEYLNTVNPDIVASSVMANRDTATTGIINCLLAEMARSKDEYTVIAYFDISRVLIDANRLNACDQVSDQVYDGYPILTAEAATKIKERLRNDLLYPWLNSINSIIKHNPKCTVIHHHTFDKYGKKTLSHDLNPLQLRPVSQFFSQKPSLNPKEISESSSIDERDTFIRAELLDKLIQSAKFHLQKIVNQPEIKIDFPYVAPSIPYTGCLRSTGGQSSDNQHIIYELRKDILINAKNLGIWIDCIHDMVQLARLSV